MICSTADGMDSMFESNVELEGQEVGSDRELLVRRADLKRKAHNPIRLSVNVR